MNTLLIELRVSDREREVLGKLLQYAAEDLESKPVLRELTGISLKDLAQARRVSKILRLTEK